MVEDRHVPGNPMSRRSSVISPSTSAPAIANGHVPLLPLPEKQATRANRAVSMTVSNALTDDTPTTDVNSDELLAPDVVLKDFEVALDDSHPTVSKDDIERQVEWTNEFGSEGA